LTELSLGTDKPISDDEFLSQFRILHLSPRHQMQAKEIFLKYQGAFSLHDCDLGCAKDVEMDIELIKKSDKPELQSYFPIAHGARKQLKDIIDQMEKYGIIRETICLSLTS